MPISVVVSGSGAYTTPPGPGAGPLLEVTYIAKVLYDGRDITSIVLFSDAEFTSKVNGTPGTCKFRIRDVEHSFSFTVGRPLQLIINGLTEWTGFVSRVNRKTAFTDGPVEQLRYFSIEGVDINILFRKRILWRYENVRDVSGVTYKYTGTPTKDTTALADMFSTHLHYLTNRDGIDTTSLVNNVADINVDQEVNAYAGSWTWEQAMNSINTLPAAVYYINPEKKLVWADVNVASAPFALSDTYDGRTSYGYREVEIWNDGTNLCNDHLALGAGAGSDKMVYSRARSATSINAHGLWQAFTFSSGTYKSQTIDRIAQRRIFGSPSSKRGQKDDKVSVSCVTYRQGLQAGMGVDFSCHALDFTDVLPVRELKITFPTPTNPKYHLTLSHEINPGWSFFDTYVPTVTIPPVTFVGSVVPEDNPNVRDEFDRSVGDGWGASQLGTWQQVYEANAPAIYLKPVNGIATQSYVNGTSAAANLNRFETPLKNQDLLIYQSFQAYNWFKQEVSNPAGPWQNENFDVTVKFYADKTDYLYFAIGVTSTSNANPPGNPSSYDNGIALAFGAPWYDPWTSGGDDKSAYLSLLQNWGYYRNAAPSYVSKTAGWMYLRLKRTNGNQWQGKFWNEGEADPDWQVVDSHSIAPGGKFYIMGWRWEQSQVLIDYVRFGDPSYYTDTNYIITPGDYRIVLVGNGTDVLYLGTAYCAGTIKVWKNGEQLVPGIGYFEASPGGGTIRIATTTDPSETYVVSCVAATETIGSLTRRVL